MEKVRQVGYWQELYRDVRSTKYKRLLKYWYSPTIWTLRFLNCASCVHM